MRDQINDVYRKAIPTKHSQKDITAAASYAISRYPELMDYYIKLQEELKDKAKDTSTNIVTEAAQVFIMNMQKK